MKILTRIANLFKRTNDLREKIENYIADVLEKASKSQIIDKGEELILNAAIEAIEAYITEQTGTNIDIPDSTKKQITTAIINGHNKLQVKIANQLRK